MATIIGGDLDSLVEMCRPEVELSNPDGSFQGREGVRAAFEPMLAATSERAVEIRQLVESGDAVVADFVFRFKNTGPLTTPQGTLPATGRQVALSSIGIYNLRAGKLSHSRGEYDRMTLLAQLGLLPAPAQAS